MTSEISCGFKAESYKLSAFFIVGDFYIMLAFGVCPFAKSVTIKSKSEHTMYESRLAKVEARIEHIENDISDIRDDIKNINTSLSTFETKISSSFIKMLLIFGAGAVSLAGLMARGFHWI